MGALIFLVEDDSALREGLIELLEREHYSVRAASSAREAWAAFPGEADLIMLDVSLPDGNGVDLCRDWRNSGVQTPILFLTARDEELDIVRGLDAGGNDYVTKPFRVQELLSRIRALLRRQTNPASLVQRGDILIDPEHMQAMRNGEVLPLTLTEYRLLALLTRRGTVVTRDQLLGELWDCDAKFVDDNTLSVHISRLRDKVGARHIRTVRGVGYQWQD